MKFHPDQPYNDLPPPPPDCELNDVQILKKVNTANKALARLRGFTGSSNRILLLEPEKPGIRKVPGTKIADQNTDAVYYTLPKEKSGSVAF